jgi:hypothetical protein
MSGSYGRIGLNTKQKEERREAFQSWWSYQGLEGETLSPSDIFYAGWNSCHIKCYSDKIENSEENNEVDRRKA